MYHVTRTELSQFMDGEHVRLVGEIVKLGDYKFDGDAKASNVNPLTGFAFPAKFYPVNIDPVKLIDHTTMIRPIRVNDIEIKSIDHMWVSRNMGLQEGTYFEAEGFIQSYNRKTETSSFCFIPCGGVKVL